MRNKRSNVVKLMASVACAVAAISVPMTSYAYNLWGYKWNTSSIKYYYDNYNSSTGKTTINDGASAWSGCDATLSNSSSYHVYCTEVDKPNAYWDGLTQGTVSGGYFQSLTVSLNRAGDAAITWNSAGARKSVAVHEFGHVLGLNDNGDTKTIMNDHTWGTNSRYETYGLTTPQADDKNGVNSIY